MYYKPKDCFVINKKALKAQEEKNRRKYTLFSKQKKDRGKKKKSKESKESKALDSDLDSLSSNNRRTFGKQKKSSYIYAYLNKDRQNTSLLLLFQY